MNINLYGKINKFYGYRKARLTINFEQVRIVCDGELPSRIEKFLEENGYHIDNHICWQIGNVFYNYSDNVLSIGNGLTIGDY